jgi:hypothetical protein
VLSSLDQGQHAESSGQQTDNGMPDGPVIILTGARSGSTLLRFILDAHPQLACPPEAGLGVACGGLARVWSVLEAGVQAQDRNQQPVELAPGAAAAIRTTLDGYYTEYLKRHEKQRWVDKSLDNAVYAKLIAQVFPDARFICLYRHCMDMIASGIESSPWGLTGFGFGEFARQYPGNSVAAVGAYWLENTRSILAFESQFSERCLRVRYEDLVSDPETVAADIFTFIGAKQVPGISEWCLAAEHDRSGPGDQKIWFTSKISDSSTGRGVQVPVHALPRPVIPLINESLAQLGYREVDENWNMSVGNVDPRTGQLPLETDDPENAAFRDAVLALIADQLSVGSGVFSSSRWPGLAGRHVHVVVEGNACAATELQWTFGVPDGLANPHGANPEGSDPDRADPDRADPDGAGSPALSCGVIAGQASVWRSVLAGELNMAMEIIGGRIRCRSGLGAGLLVTPEVGALSDALGLAPAPC